MGLAAVGNRQNVQTFECSFPTQGKDLVLGSPDSSKQLIVHSIAAFNNSVSACNIGIGMRYSTSAWKIYQLTASVTDVTAAIDGGTATAIFDTTTNHGFYVQCKNRFNMLVMNVAQAQSGSPVYEYTYWNGSAWTALTLINAPDYTGTGAAYVVFAAPVDWAQGSGGAIVSTIQGASGYVIRVRATTAGGQNVTINSLQLNKFYAYRSGIASKQQLQVKFDMRPEILEGGEGVAAYFSVTDSLNMVDVAYQIGG